MADTLEAAGSWCRVLSRCVQALAGKEAVCGSSWWDSAMGIRSPQPLADAFTPKAQCVCTGKSDLDVVWGSAPLGDVALGVVRKPYVFVILCLAEL